MNQVTTRPQGFAWGEDVPAALRTSRAATEAENATGGILAGRWPKVSYRGGKWRLVDTSGVETVVQRFNLPVIVVRANPKVSKKYYATGYDPDELAAPDCWADNGVGPGPRVATPLHSQCALCPKNVFGSAASQASGKALKACTDAKRLSVIILLPEAGPTLYELSVPAASLRNWNDYVSKVRSYGSSPAIIVTSIEFDSEPAYPKLVFSALREITAEENAVADKLYETDMCQIMVGTKDRDGAAAPASASPHLAAVEPSQPADPPRQQEAASAAAATHQAEAEGKRPPGRPKGSSNKPKAEPAQAGQSDLFAATPTAGAQASQVSGGSASGLFGAASPRATPAAAAQVVTTVSAGAEIDSLLDNMGL